MQLNALLVGYDLIGFVDGTTTYPATNHQNYRYWMRQDQLILHAIISSVDQSVVTMLGNVETSKQAWDTLNKLFASKTRHKILYLKDRLSRSFKGNQSMAQYLHGIKVIVDELSMIHCQTDDDDIVIHTLNGLGSEFREVSTTIRVRENPISFEELHDLLIDYETYLNRDTASSDSTVIATANASQKARPSHFKFKQQNYSPNSHPFSTTLASSSSKRVVCQYCEKLGHIAKVCYKIHGYPNKQGVRPTAQNAQVESPAASNDWILDSGASHHITNDLEQLHLTTPYHGKDQLYVGDGTALPITHTGKTQLTSQLHTLHLHNVLHIPTISQKLISISQLCRSNPISVEFFSDYFHVKDLRTKVPLLKGHHKQGLYHFPSASPPHAFTSTIAPPWHHILGHPSSQVLHHLVSSQQIKANTDSPCISCECSKSHKLPFKKSSLISSRPLKLIYTDVWGPAPVRSIDGFLFNLVLVDHFTKYVWLYPIKNKSDVSTIFPKFKALVEKYFNLPIVTVYSDDGCEFLKLRSFLTTHGISHFTTPPHTPQHNAPAERRHRQIVETGRALLHCSKLPPKFWSFAFLTATYLINHLPTPILHMKSPYQTLHNSDPNMNHLHSFGCLCFPWLKPYAPNKLQPKSQPCIFVGYSPTQYAYQCFDPASNKIYTSRHVKFLDTTFPYQSLIANYHSPAIRTTTDHIIPPPIPLTTALPHHTQSTSPSQSFASDSPS